MKVTFEGGFRFYNRYDMQKFMVRYNNDEVKKSKYENDLESVKKDGLMLRFIKDQTEEICLAAVRDYPFALQYVRVQTEAICLEAIKLDKDIICFIKEEFNYISI